MAEFEKKVTETNQQSVDESGANVDQKVSKVETSSDADTKTTISNVIWYIYGVIAILLGIRFILKLTGANAANGFVDFVYSLSGIFSKPFDSIFGVTTADAGQTESVFEPSILVAIAVYALIAWGIAKLLTLNEAK